MSDQGQVVSPIPEGRPRYVVRDAAYALEPQPPVVYIVDRLITAGSLNLFYGEPGSKKTYALLSLAVCVAGGLTWLDFKTNPCNVLIVDEESGERRMTRRLGEVLRGEDAGPETALSYVSLAGFKLDDPKGVDQALLQGLIEEQAAGLVIVDALADIMDGDENSKQETQPVFNALRKIAEATNAAVIVIHHSNKAGGYRGSSAIKGAVDLMARVESADGKNTINFKCEKNRDDLPQEWGAVATWIEDRFYLRPYSVQEDRRHCTKAESYVLRYLEEHGASPIPDIMGAADTCSSNSAKFAVYSLAEQGKIYRTNPDERGKGKAAIYDLKRADHEIPF